MKKSIPLESLPVLPLRGSVLFPGLVLPISVGRPPSIEAVDAALADEDRKEILVIAQRDASVEGPGQDDLYTVGTRAIIKKVARLPVGAVQLMVEGVERAVLIKVEQTEPYLIGKVRSSPLEEQGGARIEALVREIREQMARILSLSKREVPIEITQLLTKEDDLLQTVYTFASLLGLDVDREQELLEAPAFLDVLTLLHSGLAHELRILELRGEIASRARSEMSQEQREYLLRQELRAIQEELGEKNPEQSLVQELRDRLTEAELPETVRKEAERELQRLESLPAISPDHSVLRTYLEFLLELPWSHLS